MKNLLPHTFTGIFEKARNYTNIELPDSSDVLNRISPAMAFSNLCPILFYIIDYVQCQYLIFNPFDTVFFGYKTTYIRDAGPLFIYNNLFYKNDFKVFNEKVFPASHSFLKQYPAESIKDFTITTNYRVKNKSGQDFVVCQRSSYIKSADDGTPLAGVGVITDITPFKHDSKIIHIIERFDPTQVNKPIQLVNNFFFANEEDGILSKREVEVLKWVCEGLSSKQIADRLSISVHTINNHRQSMLEKTNSKSSSELIKYAILNGLL